MLVCIAAEARKIKQDRMTNVYHMLETAFHQVQSLRQYAMWIHI